MNTLTRKRNQFIFVALLIPVTLLLMFVVYPALSLLQMSFTSWDGLSPTKTFIGLANYSEMIFNSPNLWISLRNNLTYFLVHLVFIFFELLLAAMFCAKFKGAGFFKWLIFLPYIINGVAISYAFSYFYSSIGCVCQ